MTAAEPLPPAPPGPERAGPDLPLRVIRAPRRWSDRLAGSGAFWLLSIGLVVGLSALARVDLGALGELVLPLELVQRLRKRRVLLRMLAYGGAAALLLVAWLHRLRLGGVAHLHEDRVVLEKGAAQVRHTVRVADIAAFRDGSSHHVALVADPAAGFSRAARLALTIPTPGEEERAFVLEWLTARGVPRAG